MLVEDRTQAARYCADPYSYARRRTHDVMVGGVGVGGDNPIRVQSMTTPRTRDIEAQVAQIERLVEAGCEFVRITTPTASDSRALGEIRAALVARGIFVPLVADVHFNPAAAMEAALHADKVRINPGNFADTKLFAVKEHSPEQYELELLRVAEKFRPLVERCKERGVSMRIGTNHGSLSDRIMTRYGDTPLGMVESALEFVRMAESWDYHDVILSMKASNPKVMIAAYRLLASRMDDVGMTYPFHLGVTEAGSGEDGRIKSAIGIGSLLEDGIGDTVRVSLTEDPEFEIPVAYDLIRRYAGDADRPVSMRTSGPLLDLRDPFEYSPRQTREVDLDGRALGSGNPAVVFARLTEKPTLIGALSLNRPIGRDALRPDVVDVRVESDDDAALFHNVRLNSELMTIRPAIFARPGPEPAVRLDAHGYSANEDVDVRRLAEWASDAGAPLLLEAVEGAPVEELRAMEARHEFPAVYRLIERAEEAERNGASSLLLALRIEDRSYRTRAYRLLDSLLRERGADWNLQLLVPPGGGDLIDVSISLGALLCDGIGSCVSVEGDAASHADRLRLTYNVLQGAGARLTKTEFIACPSCGRTLFDLQTTTERIKARTGHLKGVKIAVMGCIVNGLGELADADFGYMGSGEGKVNLFVGKTCVEKNLPQAVADQRLVELIKDHNRWIEPPEAGD